MRRMPDKKILLIEDHHQAYYAWERQGFKNLPLVHLDAHIDFGFPEVKEARLAVEEAKSLADLKSLLEKAVLFKKKQLSFERLTNIGNYIYPAMRDGIVNEFFWIIPGGKKEFKRCVKIIKATLKGLRRLDPKPAAPVVKKNGLWQTALYGRKFSIACLDTLPRINKKVLLDIDTDFMMMESLRRANAFQQIAARKPWINPKALARAVKNKIPHPAFITIAYSVNGGFTPMVYKTLGDELAQHLGLDDKGLKKRLIAGEYFRCFRRNLDEKNLTDAKTNFQKAIKLNPAYCVADRHYGLLYLQKKKYRKAKQEFKTMLDIDPKDANSWAGMGRIHLLKKRFGPAEECFQKALSLNHNNRPALLGLSETFFRLKHLKQAKRLLRRYEKLEPLQGYPRYLLGRIYEKENSPRLASKKYREARQLGMLTARAALRGKPRV